MPACLPGGTVCEGPASLSLELPQLGSCAAMHMTGVLASFCCASLWGLVLAAEKEGSKKVRLEGLLLEAEIDSETWDLVQVRKGWEETQRRQ